MVLSVRNVSVLCILQIIRVNDESILGQDHKISAQNLDYVNKDYM